MVQQQLMLIGKQNLTMSEGEKELDTDKSDVSFESLSSRSVGYFEDGHKH
jgi:hypothetical protein